MAVPLSKPLYCSARRRSLTSCHPLPRISLFHKYEASCDTLIILALSQEAEARRAPRVLALMNSKTARVTQKDLSLKS